MSQEQAFNHTEIESRWQTAWDEADVFTIPNEATNPTYVLAMFPYTSGNLHMGHVRNYTITDAYARFQRMQGESVLHPMGWDAFGLPAENAAEERDTNPREWTLSCIETMREQMLDMGFGYDWRREVTTCDPDYYRWNQWLFKRFREAGLVERKAAEINWCPSCETVLADEQVEGDEERCWRCDTQVTPRELDQWFFTITDYADELLDALDDLDGWPNNVREMQRNWIGRQEGAIVEFDVETHGPVEVFTTRLDTIYGATFFALAPGHPIAQELAESNEAVASYLERVESADEVPETSGVETDLHAINPATGETIPVYVADYVLEDVGTGALYAVPAHDERDHAFAQEHDLPIRQVIEPTESTEGTQPVDVEASAYTEDGVLVNSGEFDGLESDTARERFVREFDGEFHTEYRLRDWLISRQRYWGTPIPIVHCPDCGSVPIPDDDLPVELPEFIHTTGNPLDAAEEWKHTSCPECGTRAERETDTMDTFVDSSWYFLRYVSPSLETAPFESDRANDWLPVDRYVGGIEHAVMHLLYSRFVTKVFDDIDLLDGIREPFLDLTNQGMVLLEGAKMSKSKGNVVSPQRIVEDYGADTARLFIMSAAQPERDFDWTAEGVQSNHDFIHRLFDLATTTDLDHPSDRDVQAVDEYFDREIAATVEAATREYENFRFNHAVREARQLVSLLRQYREYTSPHRDRFERGLKTAVKLLTPVIPHVAESCWEALDGTGLIAEADWPSATVDTDYEIERTLIETTRSDIREVCEVAGIDDPEVIELTVSPVWKYNALEVALDSEGDDLISELMQHEEIRQHGDVAANYAQDLASNHQSLQRQLTPDRERDTLQRAAWLIDREFDAEVTVLSAEEADQESRNQARPGRPAIDIIESGS